jgi:hypothetical protein
MSFFEVIFQIGKTTPASMLQNRAGMNVLLRKDIGARRLVEYVSENGREQDYLVYPILFLYRHHIELALKNIIRRATYVLDRPLTKSESKNLNHGHQLDLLWLDLKPMFAAVCKAAGCDKVSSADEDGVESHIRQLTELDPDSFSFRYAGDRKGVPYLPASLTVVNLRHCAEMVERLADYLDALVRRSAVSVQPTTSLTSGGEFELQVIAKRKDLTEEEVRLASLSIANPSSLKEISIDLKCNKARQRTAEAMRRIISRIDVRSAINPRHGLGVVARSGHGFRA